MKPTLAHATAILLLFTSVPSPAAVADDFALRCGWFENPTPGNVSLYDRDAGWILGVQGGYQLEQDWEWPEFDAGQWVTTNAGSHGFGCACLNIRVDPDSHQVLEVQGVQAKPLAACRNDKALDQWKDMFGADAAPAAENDESDQ